jgi:putative heme degradation protein
MSEIMSENNQIIENLKNSLSEVKQDESPQTPKSDFPEFKDKLMALKTKHQFFQADRKQKTDCYIF